MNTRSMYGVSLRALNILSSDTSTAVPTAVDMANYFPVGKREVKFVVSIINSSTSLGAAASVVIEECASTSTASFTTVLAYDGSSASFTSTANVSTIFEFNGIVNYRYLRARVVGTTSTGANLGIGVMALPIVRAM